MAAERITGRDLAQRAGFRSHNYLAVRLRDEKPFTLDDIERICTAFGEDAAKFMARAEENHGERYWDEALMFQRRDEQRIGKEAEVPDALLRDPAGLAQWLSDDDNAEAVAQARATVAGVADELARRRRVDVGQQSVVVDLDSEGPAKTKAARKTTRPPSNADRPE